jgi:triacylglycerol lipase
MLARLQRFTTFALIVLALIWASVAWSLGQHAVAIGGALLVAFGYALVLGLEFACLRRTHGDDDPTPRAAIGPLVRAWAGEVMTGPVVFCWRQPFRSHCWPDHLTPDMRGRRGVLLVHGFVCNRGFWNAWLARLTADGTPFVAVDLEPVFGSIDDYAAIIEDGVRRLEAATGIAPVGVAHSMGGLALRRWWAGQPDGRLHHAITIGTPHRGTWLARFAVSANGRQMQRGSPWLRALEAGEPPGRASRFTCFYGHCDNIVFPPATATLPGADNRHLDGTAHVHMAWRDEPWQALQQYLAEPN